MTMQAHKMNIHRRTVRWNHKEPETRHFLEIYTLIDPSPDITARYNALKEQVNQSPGIESFLEAQMKRCSASYGALWNQREKDGYLCESIIQQALNQWKRDKEEKAAQEMRDAINAYLISQMPDKCINRADICVSTRPQSQCLMPETHGLCPHFRNRTPENIAKAEALLHLHKNQHLIPQALKDKALELYRQGKQAEAERKAAEKTKKDAYEAAHKALVDAEISKILSV